MVPLKPSPVRVPQIRYSQIVTKIHHSIPPPPARVQGLVHSLQGWVFTFREQGAFLPPVSLPFPPCLCPPAAQAWPGPPPPASATEPLLTASWGWCLTPARREWQWAPPWQPTRLSALCTHWYSQPPGAGPADGRREPGASAQRGPDPRPGLGPCPLQSSSLCPRRSRPLQPPPPPWLPPGAAARDRWARVKGQSERRPARPFAAAHPDSHRGDWAAGAMRRELHILCSRPPTTSARPPRSRLGRRAPAKQVSLTCPRIGPDWTGLDQNPNRKWP